MKRRFGFRAGVLLLAVCLMGAGTGCTEWLAVSHAASFTAGWLLRDVTMPTIVERQCFENGVLVDCGTLPVDLGQ